jgi:hypothetical protein
MREKGAVPVEDYEEFDEPVDVQVQRPVGLVISVRLTPEEGELMRRAADGRPLSHVAKAALLDYLDTAAARP